MSKKKRKFQPKGGKGEKSTQTEKNKSSDTGIRKVEDICRDKRKINRGGEERDSFLEKRGNLNTQKGGERGKGT